MNVWRAVRCCCQPMKVFGFMSVDEHAREVLLPDDQGPGTKAFKIMPVNTKKVFIQAEKIPFNELQRERYEVVERELAIYSEDHPIEYWRQQKGFMEVK